MLTTDSALAIGLRPRGGACTPPLLPPRALLSLVVGACRRCPWRGKWSLFRQGIRDFELPWTSRDACFGSCRNHPLAARIRATQGDEDSLTDSPRSNSKPLYHPSEEIEELVPSSDGEERRLTNAETARTIIEVNSKATLILSRFIGDEVHENIILHHLPYLTDEQRDIYFEVNNEKQILQTLLADDKLLLVAIGLDNVEMLTTMEILGQFGLDFGVEEISSDESDVDDDDDDDNDNDNDDDYDDVDDDDEYEYEYEEDEATVLEDEINDLLSENTSDWTNLETMKYCHPMYFAKQIEESVSNINFDWMDQPPASIVIQGYLRPAFVDETINIKKLPYIGESNADRRSLHNGAAFYKLEMINIRIISPYGNQFAVKIQDFREAQPDVLAHSAANIISRLKAGGEKISQALKMLCLRQKGIHVEEAVVVGVDSLGFDLRVCSGRQVQTLRLAFDTQATSEFSAERQLNDLLFPRLQQKQQRWQQARQGVDG